MARKVPQGQTAFSFDEPTGIAVDPDYFRLPTVEAMLRMTHSQCLMIDVARDMHTLAHHEEFHPDRKFYEDRIASYRQAITELSK